MNNLFHINSFKIQGCNTPEESKAKLVAALKNHDFKYRSKKNKKGEIKLILTIN